MNITEIQACLSSLQRMRKRLIKLNEALKTNSALGFDPDYRVSYAEMRSLDQRCLNVLRRNLPDNDEIIQNWKVHPEKAFSVSADDYIDDYEFKIEQMEYVLDLAKVSADAAGKGGENHAAIQREEDTKYDVFISHASEDKVDLVRPLAEGLRKKGVHVWYDEFQLSIGDSLRQSIDRGLVNSRYGIVVLSPAFFAKNWPQYELDGLTAKQIQGRKVILPIWHKVDHNFVAQYSPTLADKVALTTSGKTIDNLVDVLTDFLLKQKSDST